MSEHLIGLESSFRTGRWIAHCACGWNSAERDTMREASADSAAHLDAAPGSHPTPEQRPALEGHCECGWKLIGPHDGDQWCTRCTPPGSHPTPEEDR